MSKSDSLFQLIQSLNSSEKRLFKMFVSNNSGGKETAYLDLFNAYGKLKEYTENELIKKLPSGYSVKNLAQQKKYLKDLLLKCMRELDDNRAEDDINDLMREQTFLAKKNLFKEQWKKLQKAKEIAKENELFDRTLEILDEEISYLNERDFDKSRQLLSTYQEAKEIELAKLDLYHRLAISKNTIFQMLRYFKKNIDSESLKKAQDIVSSYEEEAIERLQSFRISNLFYAMKSNLADLNQNVDETVKYRFKMVQLAKENKAMLRGDSKRLLINYSNYISALFQAGDFQRMKVELDVLEAMKFKSANDQGEFFQNITLYKILYWVNTGRLKEAFQEKDKIEKGIKTYRAKINASSLLSIYFNYSLVFFCNEKYEECINWVNKIEDIKLSVRKDLQSFARVLRVISHFQLSDMFLVESLVRSIRRNTYLHEMHKLVLSSLLSLSKNRKEDHPAILEKLKKELNAQDSFVGRDIVELWLESCLGDVPINKVYLHSIKE